MSRFAYTLAPDDQDRCPMGLIVLQTDETIEPEFSRYFDETSAPIYVSRIPSDPLVTTDTLAQMETALPNAANLLPKARPFRVVGYGCTSASSVIGSARVEQMVKQTCQTQSVTNPIRAAIAHAAEIGVSKLALLSPYIAEVSAPLRAAFLKGGLSTDVFGSFDEAEEAKVVRISTQSVVEAACKLGSDPSVEAVFVSCTNLRTYAALPQIRARIGKPALSSNQCLAWHMQQLNAPKMGN